MTIKVGDKIPDATLMQMTDKGPVPIKTSDFFKGKKVALFALPGAFTPTCSNQHLPGFIQKADAIKAKGVDAIICLSVNDLVGQSLFYYTTHGRGSQGLFCS